MSDNRAIGIFDSGVGGLTVLEECIKILPNEDFIYFGDIARAPYGSKDVETIVGYAKEICKFLIKKDIKAIVVACNTESAYALDEIKSMVNCPVIGVIEPGARNAANESLSKNIAVIATEATIKSKAYTKSINKYGNFNVVEIACPEFVPIIEDGIKDIASLRLYIKNYLSEIKATNIDTLVMGCTHYPHIEKYIREFLPRIQFINPAKETAKDLLNILGRELRCEKNEKGNITIYCSKKSEILLKLSQVEPIEIKL